MGASLDITATSQYADSGGSSVFDISGTAPVTLEAWIQTSQVPGAEAYFVSFSDSGGQSPASWDKSLRLRPDGTVDFYVWQGSAVTAVSTTVVNDGQAHHIAGTYDGTTATIYVDGVAEGTATATSTAYLGTLPHVTVNRSGYLGLVDDVRVWNVCRTQAEISASMATKLAGTEAGLVGYWPCDEGTGTVTADATANANDMTLYGGVGWGADLNGALEYTPPALAVPVALRAPAYSPTQALVPALAVPVALRVPAYSPMQVSPGPVRVGVRLPAPAPEQLARPGAAVAVPMALRVPGWDTGKFPPVLQVPVALRVPAWLWDVPEGTAARVVYRAVITGEADGVDDIEVPVETIQARARDGDPTWVSVTVPDAYTWADAILARQNGQLVVLRGTVLPGGQEQSAEILRADIGRIVDDRGSRRATVTVSGHLTEANASPKRRELRGAQYRRAGTGARTVRCLPDTFLRPGDTAVFPELGGEEYEVGLVTWIVGPTMERMEVTEKT